MHELYELKEMLMDEVRNITKKGELSAGSLDTIDKLLNSIKNACKIVMYDEYTDDGNSYASDGNMMRDGYSNARGRGSNARRDSMGRYSRDGGYAYGRGRYSYADGNAEKVEMLRDMMAEVTSEDERRTIQKLIRRMEQE